MSPSPPSREQYLADTIVVDEVHNMVDRGGVLQSELSRATRAGCGRSAWGDHPLRIETLACTSPA